MYIKLDDLSRKERAEALILGVVFEENEERWVECEIYIDDNGREQYKIKHMIYDSENNFFVHE